MISYLKEKQVDGLVYKTQFDDGFVLWKVLPWRRFKGLRESRLALGGLIDIEIEDAVYEEAVFFSSYDSLPPKDLDSEEYDLFLKTDRDHQPAGIVSTIVKTILLASGVTKGERIFSQLDYQRSLIGNIEDQIVVLICRAFPGYTPEQIDEMDWPTVLKRAAQAEMILMGYSIELPVQPIKDPEIEQQDRMNQIVAPLG